MRPSDVTTALCPATLSILPFLALTLLFLSYHPAFAPAVPLAGIALPHTFLFSQSPTLFSSRSPPFRAREHRAGPSTLTAVWPGLVPFLQLSEPHFPHRQGEEANRNVPLVVGCPWNPLNSVRVEWTPCEDEPPLPGQAWAGPRCSSPPVCSPRPGPPLPRWEGQSPPRGLLRPSSSGLAVLARKVPCGSVGAS